MRPVLTPMELRRRARRMEWLIFTASAVFVLGCVLRFPDWLMLALVVVMQAAFFVMVATTAIWSLKRDNARLRSERRVRH